MKDALLHALEERANREGFAFARTEVLQSVLKCSFDELQLALRSLSEAGRVRILSGPPYLMVALRPKVLPGARGKTPRIAPKTGARTARGHSYSYSFHLQSTDKSKAIAAEDGGAGEGERLLQEVLAALGESDPTSFRGILQNYTASRIRSALHRVRATPPEKIRKSRTALFRYLLAK